MTTRLKARIMASSTLLVVSTILLVSELAHSGRPAIAIRPVPHDSAMWRDARWVAPFVEYTEVRGHGARSTSVRWYSAAGTVLVESDTLETSQWPFGFYFTSRSGGRLTFHGMYNNWHLPAPSAETYGIASRDGRVFVQFVRNGRSAVGLTVFRKGSLVTELGAFPRMRLAAQQLGDDGSIAGLFSTISDDNLQRVIVTDSNGAITMDFVAAQCRSVHPAPNGSGALLWQVDGTLLYKPLNGEAQLMTLDPSLALASWFVVWTPGATKVLLGSEIHRTHVMLDCEQGRALWQSDVSSPWGINREWVAPYGGYVFQSGLAPAADDSTSNERVIRALDVVTGETVASWRSTPSREYTGWQDIGKLMTRDGRLYYLTDDAFSELKPEHVADAGHGCCGWEPPAR